MTSALTTRSATLPQAFAHNTGMIASTNTVAWGTSYWDTSYWDTSYWDTSYWDVMASYDCLVLDLNALFDFGAYSASKRFNL